MTVRRAVAEDDAALLELEYAAWDASSGFPSLTKPGREAFFTERAVPEEHLVAVLDDAIVGYVRLSDRYPFEEGKGVLGIHGLAVAPAVRGMGIGSMLLEAAEVDARRRGARKIRLNVLGTNDRARRLYERHGYVVDGHSREEFLIDGRLVDDYSLAKFL